MTTQTRLLTGITLVVFLTAVYDQFHGAFLLGHGSWQMTEWLINYAGGFVRRGMTGEIIGSLATVLDLNANVIVIVLSFATYGVVIAFLAVRARGHMPLFLLLSPVLLSSPAYQAGIVRKDGVALLLLLACLLVAERRWPARPTLLLLNALAVFGVLIHEMFFFVAVPILILIAAGRSRASARGTGRVLGAAALKFSPVLAAGIATVLFPGDAATATAINASWADLWRHIEPWNTGIGTPASAIAALQWDARTSIGLSASLLTRFVGGFIYAPLAWAVTIAVCFWFILSFAEYTTAGSSRRRLKAILIFQLVMIAPLFVLGWDFGRWILLWTVSSIAIYLSPAARNLPVISHGGEAPERLLPRPATAWAWCLLLFGVPTCCWTFDTVIGSMPIGRVILPWLLPYFTVVSVALIALMTSRVSPHRSKP
jgi:hypothetical protein